MKKIINLIQARKAFWSRLITVPCMMMGTILFADDEWNLSNFCSTEKRLNFEDRTQDGARLLNSNYKKLIPKESILEGPFSPDTEPDAWLMKIQKENNIKPKQQSPNQRVLKSIVDNSNYRALYPRAQEFIKRNIENIQCLSDMEAIAYKDANSGYSLTAYFRRTGSSYSVNYKLGIYDLAKYKNAARPAFIIPKTAPINPRTQKAWISLPPELIASITKECGTSLTPEEVGYLRDLMFIINENFHYFIGEPFIDLTGLEDDEAYQLIGSYIPVKSLVFDQFEQFLAPQSEQRRDLSRYLGRAAYNFHKVWDWQKTEWLTARRFTMALGLPKLTSDVILLDGQNAGAVSYHNSVRPGGVKPQELQRWGQVYRNPQFIYQMSLGLSRLMADNGVDIHAIENNPTAMKKILFSLHQLTQNYLDAYCASDYIMASAMNGKRATPNHFVGYKAMYELVPLPSFAACKPVAQLPIMINARHSSWVGDALAVSTAKVARIAGEENTLSKPEAVLGKAKRVEEPPAAVPDDKSAKSDKSRKADKEDKGEKGGKKKDNADKSEKKGKKKDA